MHSTIDVSSSSEKFDDLRSRLDPARRTILLLSDSSRSNAAILAHSIAIRLQQQYNVVALLVSAGELIDEFENCCAVIASPLVHQNYADAERDVKRLLATVPIDYAIANGTEFGTYIRALVSAFVPVVALVAEFKSEPQSRHAIMDALEWSTCVVFSDRMTADTAMRNYPKLSIRKTYILPHGTNEPSDTTATTRLPAHDPSDVDQHAVRLDQLAHDSIAIMRQRAQDFVTLRDDPLFDAKVFLPPNSTLATREGAIIEFLARWASSGNSRLPNTNFFLRRPCAGFHPQIYAYENAHRYDITTINPLAHLIRSDRPQGPWNNDLIEPGLPNRTPARAAQLPAAIHGHFFYPELAADFLQRLACNHARCDLWLTTDDNSKATILREATRAFEGGDVAIRVVPNRGRDIGAFLTAIVEEIEPHYDVIGHIHGKRSPQTLVGEQWRQFLWQNLVGDPYPMMDVILDRFAADETLGIVFADDPHLPDWDSNLEIAAQLAGRMGIKGPLPPFFNFPVGTMFWARPRALKPLFELNLGWGDYPEEPVLNDGTILHAIERLLPLVVQHAGYRYATTYVPEVTWSGG